MTIYSSFVVAGSQVDKVNNVNIEKSLGDINYSSNFTADIVNYTGENAVTFGIGDEVNIYDSKNIMMSENLRRNLVGYWNCDEVLIMDEVLIPPTWGVSETPTVSDSFGKWIYGTAMGVNSNESGKINKCFKFSSPLAFTSFDSLGNTNLFPANFTVSFWIKMDSSFINANGIRIIDTFQSFGGDDYNWQFEKNHTAIPTKNYIRFYVFGTTFSSIDSTDMVANIWYHVVGTYDGTTANLYVDNVNVGSDTTDMNIYADTVIFGDTNTYSIPGPFYLDEIGIFNRVITTDEISELYNNGVGKGYGNRVFSGIVETVKYKGQEEKENIILGGRDYTARLLDRTVEPEVYNNLYAGSIVRDIISKYTNDITTNYVADNGPEADISRITFKHLPVFDAVKQLADFNNFNFYVDETKDLKFKEKETISSGYIFDNTNIMKSDVEEQRYDIYNQIWVYGDRYLDGYKETFVADGGSDFSLIYSPHNTNITVGGSICQPGGVYNMSATTSGLKYLVSYDDKKIIFVSGTNAGNFIPTSGNSIIATYDRSLPIVKAGDNEPSKAMYGTKIKIIQDTNIKDPLTSEIILLSELDKWSDPAKQLNIDVRDVDKVNLSETCVVDIPFHNINNQTYEIIGADYNFNKENELNDTVLKLKLNKNLPGITDTLKDIMLQLRRIQSTTINTGDIITRYQWSTGSFGMRTSGLNIYTNMITQSGLYCYWVGGDYTITGTLASGINQRGLFGDGVGSPFSPLEIVWSGGYI